MRRCGNSGAFFCDEAVEHLVSRAEGVDLRRFRENITALIKQLLATLQAALAAGT
jgi:hypothetical protein